MPLVPSIRAAIGDVVSRWAVESQQAARRNAMVASTDLAALRKERVDVDDFLADRTSGPTIRPDSDLDPTTRVRGAL